MWAQLYQTLRSTLELCNTSFKQWAGAGLLFARTFFVLGTTTGFAILAVLAFLFNPSWLVLDSGEQYLYYWTGHAVELGIKVMVMSSGMLAAYLRRGLPTFTSFSAFSKEVPRGAWRFFFLAALLMAIVYFLNVYLAKSQQPQGNSISSAFRFVNGQAYLPWIYDIVNMIFILLPYLLAGLLYLKTLDMPYYRALKPAFICLVLTGYITGGVVWTLYVQAYRLLLQPVLITVSNDWFTLLATSITEAVFYMNFILIAAFLIQSAFSDTEETLDIENEIVEEIATTNT
jgi:hypothetical protein